MKHLLYLILTMFTTGVIAQNTDTIFQKIYFDFDKYEITDESEISLMSIKNDKRTIQKVFIEANTDYRGSVEYNIKLGANRANATKDYLSKIGLNADLITILNYGESKPLFENRTEDGMAKNRRVDIMILYESENDVVVEEEAAIDIPDYSNEDLYDFLKDNEFDVSYLYDEIAPEPQRFTVSVDRDTILVTESGIIIEIPDLAFKCDCEGETVELSVREGVTYEQMLTQQFITIDGIGEPLQTGGMIDISARTSSGKTVELQNDIDISIPTTKPVEGMEFFIGENQKITDVDEKTGVTIERNEQRWTQFQDRTITTATFTLMPQGGNPCCTPDCVVEESEEQINYWKKNDEKSYEAYVAGMEKAKKDLLENCERLMERRAAIQQSFANQGITANNAEMSYYQLSLPGFRPVNVDIYLNRPKLNLVAISTSIPTNKAISYFYINTKENYVIPGSDYNKVFRVPMGKHITILGLGVNRDGGLMMGLKKVIAKRDKVYDLEFQEVSKKELKKVLATLDR